MTLHLLDIASYQAGLNLARARDAGFSLVNIKTSQGDWYTYSASRGWADKARAQKMGICTFHWLDNSASGKAQADIAFKRMKEMGGPDGFAHQCDCEDNEKPASLAIMRDYVNHMQDLMGRHIVMYTGDWWWTPRKWTAASLTPYLWAAPNSGYLKSYPGDTSTHWKAGYGGWANYSILQYAVSEIEGAGGGKVSKSAIRDPKVWAALTGGDMAEKEVSVLTTSERGALDACYEVSRSFTDMSVHWGDKTRPGGEINNKFIAAFNELVTNVGALKTDIAAIKAAPPGSVVIPVEQLKQALRELVLELVGQPPAGAGS